MAGAPQPAGSNPRGQAACRPPLQAQCVAAEAEGGRASGGGQLLAGVEGTQLLVAAAGRLLLLLRGTEGRTQPAALQLLECPAAISAVAVSTARASSGGSEDGGTSEEESLPPDSSSSSADGEASAPPSAQQRWAAALAGDQAFLVPFSTGGSAAAGPSSSIEAPAGSRGWDACAWHPSLLVCALAAASQLLLVDAAALSTAAASSGSSSDDDTAAEEPASSIGDSAYGAAAPSGVLAAVAAPGCGPAGSAAEAALGGGGRCCLAWLEGGPVGGTGGTESSCWGRLAVSQGMHLELLTFGPGWQVLERRQQLTGLVGPICGLASAGSSCLLVGTEQPVGSWLNGGDHQQQEGEEDGAPQVLLRGLQEAQRRQQQSVLLPAAPGPGSSGSMLPNGLRQSPPAQTARSPGAAGQAAAPAEDGDGAAGAAVIDLTRRSFDRSLSAPAVPARFLLPALGRLGAHGPHMPLEEGLPALPLSNQASPGAGGGLGLAAQGGQAALVWVEQEAGGSGRSSSGSRAGNSPGMSAGQPAAAAGEAAAATPGAVPAPFAPDLLCSRGSLAVLAGSKSASLCMALCSLGGQRLCQQCGGAVQLSAPAGVPEGSTVRLRGLAVGPGSPAAGSEAGSSRAAAEDCGAAGQTLVWALLSAAPRPPSNPFLSAALAGGGGSCHQLWLCCWRLADLLPLQPAPSAPMTPVPRSLGQAAAPGSGAPAAAGGQQAAAREGADGPPAAASPAEAVAALKEEVAALRQSINAQLDGLTARLDQLLQALAPAPSAAAAPP